jgi:hypothetical protein
MNIPYEYCAYRFLELWERGEKQLHEFMSETPSAGQVRLALKYFRVARNFKGLSDGTAEEISKALIEVSDDREASPPDKVVLLASRFKVSFNQSNVSAASKLLWLRNRSPHLIYDSRAVNALCRLGKKFDKADYLAYCGAWLEEYKKRSDEISLAARGLITLPREYTAAFELTDCELTQIVNSDWFLERVFDIYLWETGKTVASDKSE